MYEDIHLFKKKGVMSWTRIHVIHTLGKLGHIPIGLYKQGYHWHRTVLGISSNMVISGV